jgi:hypothetical protein
MYQANYLTGMLATATIPARELIGAAQALALLIGLLVLCCTVLWWLSQPTEGDAPMQASAAPSRTPRRGGLPRSRATRVLMASRATGRS